MKINLDIHILSLNFIDSLDFNESNFIESHDQIQNQAYSTYFITIVKSRINCKLELILLGCDHRTVTFCSVFILQQ